MPWFSVLISCTDEVFKYLFNVEEMMMDMTESSKCNQSQFLKEVGQELIIFQITNWIVLEIRMP